jgi:hypothetical protein
MPWPDSGWMVCAASPISASRGATPSVRASGAAESRLRGDQLQRAEPVIAGFGDARTSVGRVERSSSRPWSSGRRPDHRHAIAGQRQPGQHAVGAEPLERPAAMRLFAARSWRPRRAGRKGSKRTSIPGLRPASMSRRHRRPTTSRAKSVRPSSSVSRAASGPGQACGRAGQSRVRLPWRLTVFPQFALRSALDSSDPGQFAETPLP